MRKRGYSSIIQLDKINKRNKERLEKLTEVKKTRMRPIWREVNKFRRMVGDFRKELREGIELYDNNKDDPERLATVSVELQRKKKHLEHMSTLRGTKLEKAKKEL